MHSRSRNRWLLTTVTAGLFAAILVAVLGTFFAGWSTPRLGTIEAAYRAGDYSTALQSVQTYTSRHPTQLAGWRLQGRIYDARQEFGSAAESYRRGLLISPDDLDLHHAYGTALLQSAQFSIAEEAYRQILTRSPTDAKAQTELQWILFHQLRERELETFLEACLTLEPTNGRILYHLLVSSQKRPNAFESLPVLEKINSACPNQPSILLGLARCAWRVGDIAWTRSLLEGLHALPLTGPELWLVSAEFELEQVRTEAAAETLAKLQANFAADMLHNDRWWRLHGLLAQQKRDYPRALECFRKAAELNPRDLTCLQAQASLLQAQGQTSEARSLRDLLERRRTADQALYLIVSSGELNAPTPELAGIIAEHCRTLGKSQQADGWLRWSSAALTERNASSR